MTNENLSSDSQDSSSTQKKKGGWKSVKYILGNETLEKLASMSLIANLIVYMHTQYNMDTTLSVEVFNIWSGFTNFLPLIAAYMADAYIGKFKMVIFGSIASFLGMAFMSLGSGVPSLRPPACSTLTDCVKPTGTQLAILYAALAFFAIGSGSLRPCNIAFGADQFDTTTEKGRAQLESFCNWWYFLFTVALLVALTIVVYIQTNISWFLGYIIPTVCFAISLIIFLFGQSTYIKLKPKGSILGDLLKVVNAAIRKHHVDMKKDSELTYYDPPIDSSEEDVPVKLAHTNRFRFLDKAAVITNQSEIDERTGKSIDHWRLCSLQQVEELKSILNTLPVWLAGIVCFLSMGQANSFGILQALQTNKLIGKHFNIPPAWMGLVPMIALSLWILIYEKFYVPWTMKKSLKGKRLSIEQRITIGIIFSIVCMVVAGLVEERRRNDALKNKTFESPTTIWWLIPQFALSGLIEVFAAIPMMELLTSYWPESMKTLGGAVFFLSLSIASSLNNVLIKIIEAMTKNEEMPWLGGNDLNKNRLEYYYYTIAALGGLNLLYFLFFARFFLSSEVLKRESKIEAKDEENA